jgi:hypothetical protein
MADLKTKAKARSSKHSGGGKLKKRATSRKAEATAVDPSEEPLQESTPNIASPLTFSSPPPTPPAMSYLRHLALIPGLRDRTG